MEFAILGPLEVRRDGQCGARRRRPRAVLAMLLLHANEPVSAERLAGTVWGEDSAAGRVRTVQVYVSRLRKALGGDDVLARTPAGYWLWLREGELDADRFERLVDDGREALAEGRPELAGGLLWEALGLWRGPALGDLPFEASLQGEAERLEEQRVAAIEARIEADFTAGRQGELIPELQALVGQHPLREGLPRPSAPTATTGVWRSCSRASRTRRWSTTTSTWPGG